MKLFRTLLFFACALSLNSIFAQNLMNIHQGNGTLIQIPLESIDSVRFVTVPPPTIQKIFQSNGNILSIAVSDIDSITYTIPNSAALATISTQSVTVLSSSSAYAGGTITSAGNSTITQRGVCWNTSPNPTLANNFSVDGTGIGSYGSNMAPLQSATTYYVRAYAVNSEGTAYGNQLTFTTSNPSTSGSLATITTDNVVYLNDLTATCGGNITADGGLAVTARGVCWATGTTPTINNYITNNGAGGGAFTSTLTNLLPYTSYFVRAYATNDAGTSYGITYSLTTSGPPYSFQTMAINSITDNSASSGGFFISAPSSFDCTNPLNLQCYKGICWSTSPNPTVDNNTSNDGIISNYNPFTSNITGLLPGTTYYVRAFYAIMYQGALSSIGAQYGTEQSFTTTNNGIISNPGSGVTYNGYTYTSIVLSNGQEWMSENLKTAYYRNGDPINTGLTDQAWFSTTSGAYAIYNNDVVNNNIYGKLYNWYAVGDPRNLCPADWHVPTDAEWSYLINCLDPFADGGNNDNIVGGKLKSVGTQYWLSPNQSATNEIGFSALPGGVRNSDGTFFSISEFGHWWSSTLGSNGSPFYRVMNFEVSDVWRDYFDNDMGFSVRCIKD